jgi:predicted Zn-dependent protease
MRIRHWLIVALAFGLVSCQTVQTTSPGAVGIDRKQRMLISEAQVEQGALNTDPQTYKRVQAIAQRLIPHVSVFRPDAAQWKWEINVQDSDDVNAYCMPGGKIMVYTGLIEKLQATDAELAAVIGHEIAHALREHSRERLSRAYAEQLALAGIAFATGASQTTMELASQISAITFQLPHSREQESEADRMGLELMARAGYDPNAAITLWQKMARVAGSAPPEFLSTHPSSESRIRDLQATIPKVQALYLQSRAQ